MLSLKSAIHASAFCLFLLALGVLGATRPAVGDDFRVENQVFAADSSIPRSQSVTVFYEGQVFDCLDSPAEVIVFDKAAGRFILLDMNRRIRAELTIKEVGDFTARLKQTAAEHNNPRIRFLVDPNFQEEFDARSGELILSSPWMTYEARLVTTPTPAIAEQYREFSDWYARLNTILIPQSRPPFARLALNHAMAKHRATATQVELTIKSSPKPVTVRSQHQLVLQLTAADLDRVAEAREAIRTFKAVDFEQYRKGR